MILKKLSEAQSVYSTQRWKQDFNKHKTLSEMISKATGTNSHAQYIARTHKFRYFVSPRGSNLALDQNTVFLVRNILSRRSQRAKGTYLI